MIILIILVIVSTVPPPNVSDIPNLHQTAHQC